MNQTPTTTHNNKMGDNADPLTTEIQIPVDNAIIADLLSDRYSRMDRGEVRAELEELYGKVWDEAELLQEYRFERFEAPYAHVTSLADGTACTLAFTADPRFFFLLRCEDAHE